MTPADEASRGPGARAVLLLPFALGALLLAATRLPRIAEHPTLGLQIAGATGLLLLGHGFLVYGALTGRRPITAAVAVKRPHYLQLVAQGGVYAMWGWYWPPVYPHFQLIAVQLLFAYLLEMLFYWSRKRHWNFGFNSFPVVLSINLFLWFKDEYFFAQLLMVAGGVLSKELIQWVRDGQRTHIFNPSAIVLSLAAVVLIAGGWSEVATHGLDISIHQGNPPYCYETIFAVGLLVQAFFPVVLTTMSAAVTLWVVTWIYGQVTGSHLFIDTAIPIAVYLGMTLLVSDPQTSPRSRAGRVLFGAVYGVCVALLYVGLKAIGTPPTGTDPGVNVSYFDKLLQVPILNLMVPIFERVGRWTDAQIEKVSRPWPNWVHVGLWVVLFLSIRPWLVAHEGRNPEFWSDHCDQGVEDACRHEAEVNEVLCERGVAQACHNLGVIFELGKSLPEDLPRAAGAFSKGCDLGLSGSCTALGMMYVQAMGVPEDPSRAYALFERACAASDPDGCVNQAGAYLVGLGVAPDRARARELYERACHAGSSDGCDRLKALGP